MGDDRQPILAPDGIHAGDFVLRPVPSLVTDGHLDTPESRERALRQEQDARAAQRSGTVNPAHPIADPTHPAPVPVVPLGEGGAMDAAIDAARAATMGDGPDDPPIPILLHDPLTGQVIGTG